MNFENMSPVRILVKKIDEIKYIIDQPDLCKPKIVTKCKKSTSTSRSINKAKDYNT